MIFFGGIVTLLLVVAGPIWFLRLWSQVRQGRLYFFTTALRNCVRRNLPLAGAVQAVMAERVVRPSVLGGVVARLLNGFSLGESLAASPDFFPPEYAALVDLGERSGQLPAVLDYLAADLAEDRRARAYLFTRLAYPVTLLVVYGVVAGFIMIKVVPKFRDIFSEFAVPVPPTFKTLLVLWRVVGGIGVPVLLAAFLLALVFKLLGNLGVWHTVSAPRRLAGRVRSLVGVPGRRDLATAAASLSAALRAGAVLPEALAMSARAAREGPVKEGLLAAGRRAADGDTLSAALAAQAAFPRTFLWMVRSGEVAGRLPEALRQLEVLYVQRHRQLVHFLGSLVIPVVTCALAFMVFLLAYSVLGSEAGLLGHLSGMVGR